MLSSELFYDKHGSFLESLPSMFETEGNSSENEEFGHRTSSNTEGGTDADIIKGLVNMMRLTL